MGNRKNFKMRGAFLGKKLVIANNFLKSYYFVYVY
jgi:hypothetical protein